MRSKATRNRSSWRSSGGRQARRRRSVRGPRQVLRAHQGRRLGRAGLGRCPRNAQRGARGGPGAGPALRSRPGREPRSPPRTSPPCSTTRARLGLDEDDDDEDWYDTTVLDTIEGIGTDEPDEAPQLETTTEVVSLDDLQVSDAPHRRDRRGPGGPVRLRRPRGRGAGRRMVARRGRRTTGRLRHHRHRHPAHVHDRGGGRRDRRAVGRGTRSCRRPFRPPSADEPASALPKRTSSSAAWWGSTTTRPRSPTRDPRSAATSWASSAPMRSSRTSCPISSPKTSPRP